MISNDLHSALEASIGPIRSLTAIGGGDINEAARVETSDARYFVKWNYRPRPHVFQAEARGLNRLAAVNALRVPRVIAVIEQPAALALEWIDLGSNKSAAAEALGRGLAQQHRSTAEQYGLDHDNYIGSTPQQNAHARSWIEFYRDQRLGVQRDLAQRNGYLTPDRARRLDRVMAHLDQWIDGQQVAPSLLHGDLWGGNYLIDVQGNPVLIDPAVYYGDREAEIAFTELFGGFGVRFYAAYHEAWPLDRGYADRRDLYNLYHLLNHLNLFGEGYGGSVDTILRHYAG
ncbi:MAG TPA: fructosamine kinase family protein [Anaerolineae bacterium]|nr:fructosamine kinase family protein [Anaerolineae bacterium]